MLINSFTLHHITLIILWYEYVTMLQHIKNGNTHKLLFTEKHNCTQTLSMQGCTPIMIPFPYTFPFLLSACTKRKKTLLHDPQDDSQMAPIFAYHHTSKDVAIHCTNNPSSQHPQKEDINYRYYVYTLYAHI